LIRRVIETEAWRERVYRGKTQFPGLHHDKAARRLRLAARKGPSAA
jgi:hypothetical protein